MVKPEPIKIFKTSWDGFKQNWIFWTIIGVIFTLIKLPIEGISKEEFNSNMMLGPLFGVSMTVFALNALVMPFIYGPALLTAEKKDVNQEFFKRTIIVYLKLIGYGLIYMIMVTIGLIALIFPGVYLGARYSMGFYFIYNNPKIGFFDAFTKSSQITEGKTLSIFTSWFFVGLIANIFSSIIIEAAVLITGFSLAQTIQYLIEVVASTVSNSFPAIAAAAIYLQIKKK
ncbi:hypothetical protein HY844_00365 [Candidatus Berkelbacteria bacterium]|nr:hypothetical protein [Candidatus Berkelbacteria bacterium]